MFGHNDPQQHHDEGGHPAPTADGALSDDNQSLSAPPMDGAAGDFIDDVPAPAAAPAVTLPSVQAVSTTVQPAPAPEPAADAPTSDTVNTDQLLDIKQQALQQLTPLVGHLDQSPEEKFRTTMMMIQAADNHALIQTAYEAAQNIVDEKIRAQALLDIVNEINYFTHNDSQAQTAA